MWTQNITGAIKNRASINIMIDFLKDGKIYDSIEWKGIQPESINTMVKNQLMSYQKIDSYNIESLMGDYQLIPDEIIDQDRKTFRENYVKYIQAKKAIDAKLGKVDEAFTDLEALIKATYKDEYANIIKEVGN